MIVPRIILAGGRASELCMAAGLAQELGAHVTLAEGVEAALATARTDGCDLMLVEVALDVGRLVERLRAERMGVPVLACGIAAPAELAVAAIRAGASDYVPLPPERALIAAMLRDFGNPPAALIGEHPRFRRAVDFALSLAPSPLPMLITAEPGTGRQLLAWHVHRTASVAGKLVTVNCAGVRPEFLGSELFGHARGAFGSASEERTGAVVQAAGGTLLLRDVDALPPALQGRLLDALDRRTWRAVATSAADLRQRVADGRFRGDLLERFAAATISLPPLRERGADLELLVAEAAGRHAAHNGLATPVLAESCWPLLRAYRWPGNIRELDSVVQRAVLLSGGGRITPDDLLLENGQPLQSTPTSPVDELVGRTMEDVERTLILQTLDRCNGNRTSASNILGISVRTMRNKLKAFTDAGFSVAPAA